jgi:hypothetical protein
MLINKNPEHNDECVTADEVYTCGLTREPDLTDMLVKSSADNTTIVTICFLKACSAVEKLEISRLWELH